jgi:hydroxyacylglutathione hydrolase
MRVEAFPVGMLATNCYVASSETGHEAIIVDPGMDYAYEAEQIIRYIENNKLTVKLIVNTHGHSDHINGDLLMQKKFNVPIYIHALDVPFITNLEPDDKPDLVLLKDGDLIQFGSEKLRVLHSPGHTPGCICLVGEKVIFTGDTLFASSIGRTDFPESTPSEMDASLRKLLGLSDDLIVYSGHGEVSVLGVEKRVNPFLQGL